MPNSVQHFFNVTTSTLASSVAAWRGTMVLREAEKPKIALKLFEFEGCPYCRAVREALTALHLDADIYPCPKNGSRFRSEALRMGGKMQFPLLVDENQKLVLYESADIITHLFQTYAKQEVPLYYQKTFFKDQLSGVATALRGGAGIFSRPSRAPAEPLHLWSFESSPFSRLVRERLCELEIPYHLHNVGKERWEDLGPAVFRLKPGTYEPVSGGKRAEHFARTGHMQVPYLEDPNTGAQLLESSVILDYLDKEYSAAR